MTVHDHKILARGASYDELREILIARRRQLGLPAGDTAKIEAGGRVSGLGQIEGLLVLAAALGVELALVPAEATAADFTNSDSDAKTCKAYVEMVRSSLAERGRKGGRITAVRMTRAQRRENGRAGGRKRWALWREARAAKEAKARRQRGAEEPQG